MADVVAVIVDHLTLCDRLLLSQTCKTHCDFSKKDSWSKSAVRVIRGVSITSLTKLENSIDKCRVRLEIPSYLDESTDFVYELVKGRYKNISEHVFRHTHSRQKLSELIPLPDEVMDPSLHNECFNLRTAYLAFLVRRSAQLGNLKSVDPWWIKDRTPNGNVVRNGQLEG
jgi:hypothetical protein